MYVAIVTDTHQAFKLKVFYMHTCSLIHRYVHKSCIATPMSCKLF